MNPRLPLGSGMGKAGDATQRPGEEEQDKAGNQAKGKGMHGL